MAQRLFGDAGREGGVRKGSKLATNSPRRSDEGHVMNISFENKVALVTGAGSGLGLATAQAFARSGASVVLADWHMEAVQAAAAELVAEGCKAHAIRCDVSNDREVEAMVDKTIATFGRL